MAPLAPIEVVRLIFEARAAGDVPGLLALMDPDVRATMGPSEDVVIRGRQAVKGYLARELAAGVRVEVDAHRVEPIDDEHVDVIGRIRVIERAGLTDSPAAWRITVRRGRVVEIAPLEAARAYPRARLRRVA